VFAAAVAAVVVLAVMVSVSTREEMTADLAVGPTDTATVAPAVVPTFPPSRSFGDVSPKFAGSERPTADRSARAKESAVPEVLIAPDAVLAFQQFVAGVEERRFEISFDEPLPVAPTPQFTELTISPITIEPLEPIAVDEGVLQ
jgi:hypothetical protein